jgi:hypothetical protein
MNNLPNTTSAMEDRARELKEKVPDGFTSMWSAEHPNNLMSMANLASTMSSSHGGPTRRT